MNLDNIGASVRYSNLVSVWNSVWDYAGDPIENSIGGSVRIWVQKSVRRQYEPTLDSADLSSLIISIGRGLNTSGEM
jgi:hypothetical protein